jgi:DNA-binding transcriptional LysR family regulator
VAPLLVELMRHHPRLRFDVSFSDRVADIAEEGFDLAVRLGPLPDRAGLRQRKLADINMTVCASPAYLARHGTPRSIADLAGHELLFYGRPWLLSKPDGGWEEIPKGERRFNFQDLEAVADAAAAGLGVAWLPCWLIRERCESGSLIRVLADLPGLSFGVHAVWPDAPFMPRRLRAVIDLLAARLPDQVPLRIN